MAIEIKQRIRIEERERDTIGKEIAQEKNQLTPDFTPRCPGKHLVSTLFYYYF